ncbi:cupin domain-containing protein [Flavobacterium sp. LB1P62]|uniref:cupin domain-containing protein n=1 Tax=unclassified Flavobacterium TaxID=196869 RepID=UPI003AAAC2C3
MKAIQKTAIFIVLGIFCIVVKVQSQDMKMSGAHIMIMPDEIKWGGAPSGLPPGSQAAVLEGNPSVAGLFTMRAKIPANYKIMPHWHPADEHITVLQGTCFMGMGDKYDENAAMKMVKGGFAVMKTGSRHYFFTKEECVIQLHGMGPWGITYVNTADDPRNKK